MAGMFPENDSVNNSKLESAPSEAKPPALREHRESCTPAVKGNISFFPPIASSSDYFFFFPVCFFLKLYVLIRFCSYQGGVGLNLPLENF